MKPHSPACDRNRDPILAVLLRHLSAARTVLEIGSGTGQHAVHFAQAMPDLIWQCSDRAPYLPGIRQWLDEAQLPNTPHPLELDVVAGPWPSAKFDAVFSANTLHIMGWEEVQACFDGLHAVLAESATLVVYGPFNYHGMFTSDSNREFDASLRVRDSRMGIRDFEAIDTLARNIGLRLIEDASMPANNRCLVWRRLLV
jgi:cyclopropane fatty-acyl-phospholipid synthase-like methyltransferase